MLSHRISKRIVDKDCLAPHCGAAARFNVGTLLEGN